MDNVCMTRLHGRRVEVAPVSGCNRRGGFLRLADGQGGGSYGGCEYLSIAKKYLYTKQSYPLQWRFLCPEVLETMNDWRERCWSASPIQIRRVWIALRNGRASRRQGLPVSCYLRASPRTHTGSAKPRRQVARKRSEAPPLQFPCRKFSHVTPAVLPSTTYSVPRRPELRRPVCRKSCQKSAWDTESVFP